MDTMRITKDQFNLIGGLKVVRGMTMKIIIILIKIKTNQVTKLLREMRMKRIRIKR